jgi:dTDP-4-dehydrorhamnose reductase
MKIAVTGANGQLGLDVVDAFRANGDEVFPLTHADVEIADLNSAAQCLRKIRPQTIVNTAAMHHVEKCEEQPEKAFAVNAIGARNLALLGKELNATLVHISTDYVFDGNQRHPYEELDVPRPLQAYGITKLAAENFLRAVWDRHFVLRTSGLYGRHPCRAKGGRNFVDLMLKLGKERPEVRVVDDEVVSPTSTCEVARQIVALSRSDAYGLYHATAEGSCSWYQFARTIFELTGTAVHLKIADPHEFPAKVPRPKYSVLENRELKARGLNVFRPWQEGLKEYLETARAQ